MKAFLGADLSASQAKKSAYALLLEDLSCLYGFFTADRELLEIADQYQPEAVGIDAPLSLPSKGYYRGCEKALQKLGVRSFSPIFKGMIQLTTRAMRLKEELEKRGYEVIEVYPGGTQDLLGLPRKRKGRDKLYSSLVGLGLRIKETRSGDILDAVTAALTVYAYKRGEYILVSSSDGCKLVLASPAVRELLCTL